MTFAGLLSYTERLISKFPGRKLMSSSSAKAPVAATTPDKKSVTARPVRKAGGRLDKHDPATFIENILPVLRLQATCCARRSPETCPCFVTNIRTGCDSRAAITNIHSDPDDEVLCQSMPARGVIPAYDGMRLTLAKRAVLTSRL